MIAYLLIALYWIACCITVYIIRNRRTPLHKITRAKTKFWEHVIIVLLCPLAVPILLLGFAYRACRNWYYRNRPKPLPKRIKKYMKKDCVLDEDNNTISLAEYNYKHGTTYTLDDVYGKGYFESLTEEEKADITTESTKYGILEVQENIPDSPYTNAAKVLGEALLSGDFTDFGNLLDSDAEHISYNKETISGKEQVIEYWRGWRTRYVETRKAKKFEVVYSNYYSNACLLMEMMVVMFFIREDKVQKVLLIQRHLNPMIGYHEDILEFEGALALQRTAGELLTLGVLRTETQVDTLNDHIGSQTDSRLHVVGALALDGGTEGPQAVELHRLVLQDEFLQTAHDVLEHQHEYIIAGQLAVLGEVLGETLERHGLT